MTNEEIWNDDGPIGDRFDGIEVPPWIDPDISPSTVAAIVQGGCDSGAYMPAVTYGEALDTMGRYGDTIFDYIDDASGSLPGPDLDGTWMQWACFYVSTAVELWASSAMAVLEDFEPDDQ